MKTGFTISSSLVGLTVAMHAVALAPTLDVINTHVLKRMTLAPTADTIEAAGAATPTELVESLLTAPALDPGDPAMGDEEDDWFAVIDWWLDVMRRPDAGLHERMVWFWHGHLTSSMEKADPRLMYRQLQLLRRNAMGNFRTMLQEITIDPAMLWWLDGAESRADAPNENYSRELMELFALGRESGAYTETDVHNGARALAGWWVDDEDDDGPRVILDAEIALRGSVEFLGRRVRTAAEVVDAVCDHPACPQWIAGKVYEAFFRRSPTDARRAELADVFRSAELEIAPLVAAVATDPAFVEERSPAPRSALEWYLATEQLLGERIDPWALELLDQVPLVPPNVAGWPGSDRWVSSGAMLTKASIALDHSWDTDTLDAADPVGDVLYRAGLSEVSEATRAALEDLARSVDSRRERSSLLSAAVAMCPEFNVT